MKGILEVADHNDPKVQNTIRKNHRVANECIRFIARKNKKLDPEKAYEAIFNTAGVVCAELIREAYEMGGEELAEAMADLFKQHIDRSISLLDIQVPLQ